MGRAVSARRLAAVLAASALLGMAGPAAAHRLVVFASVEDGAVLVEAKFSSGRKPVAGEVRVLDAQDRLLVTLALGPDGTLRFPLAGLDAAEGLTIEVKTGEGHDDYWVLTPADIAAGTGG
jgi:nickel transport protein